MMQVAERINAGEAVHRERALRGLVVRQSGAGAAEAARLRTAASQRGPSPSAQATPLGGHPDGDAVSSVRMTMAVSKGNWAIEVRHDSKEMARDPAWLRQH